METVYFPLAFEITPSAKQQIPSSSKAALESIGLQKGHCWQNMVFNKRRACEYVHMHGNYRLQERKKKTHSLQQTST